MELTAEEKAIGDKAILKFEQSVRHWRKFCIVFLVLGILGLVYGAYILVECLRFGFESRDDAIQRYMVEAEQLPSGTERDVWMVGTFRKAAMILENRFSEYKWSVVDAISGLFMSATGLIALALSVIVWQRAPQQWLLAKILRAKWEEEIR
jgi:hypothetical protein